MNNFTKSLNEPAASIFKVTLSHDRDVILEHIWDRLRLEPTEWRKIFKALHLLDMVLKVGDPQCISSIKGNMYKIKSFQSFTVKGRAEKSSGIREKSKTICDYIDNPEMLEEEREKIRALRNKLAGKSVSSGKSNSNDRRKVWRNKQQWLWIQL